MKRRFLMQAAAAALGVIALQPDFPIRNVKPTRFDRENNPPTEFQTWAIRFGAEPIDLHIADKKLGIDTSLLSGFDGAVGGPGRIFNHNYIEIGTLDQEGNFESRKRIHGIGLDKYGKMTGEGTLIGFVIDGKHTRFEDDPIQADDPHKTRRNQLQHALVKNRTGGDYTKIVYKGSEAGVMALYAAMVQATIQFNDDAKRNEFHLLGQTGPNSNSFNSLMKRILNAAARERGDTIDAHDAWGWDIGHDYKIPLYTAFRVPTTMPLPELRYLVDGLEKRAAEQLVPLRQSYNPFRRVLHRGVVRDYL